MILILLSTLLALNPLAATEDVDGIWFVSDISPGMPGPKFEISKCDGDDSFLAILPLQYRPLAIGIQGDLLWFVDHGEGIGLYHVQIETQQVTPSASLFSYFTTELVPIDLEFNNGNPIVICQDEVLQCIEFDGAKHSLLPPLNSRRAFVTVLGGGLIAASQEDQIVTMWQLKQNQWVQTSQIPFHGELTDVIAKDDWPVLISLENEQIFIQGVQGGHLERIATLEKPKGRWRVLSSPNGLVLLSSEQNGTSNRQNIGWPSGISQEPIELSRKEQGIIFDSLLSLLFPLLLCFLLLVMFRRKA